MKNKRQLAKQQTAKKILQSTKQLIEKYGIINLKTIDVAKKAEIAHGTLFSHFETKEILISEICQAELKTIAKKLKKIADKKNEISILLDNYLSIVANNEDFFTILVKEFPFLDEKIQHSIIANETIIKHLLYSKIENLVKNEDITMKVSFFFASVNYYLSRKEYFIENEDSVIKKKKEKIIKTFLKLLT